MTRLVSRSKWHWWPTTSLSTTHPLHYSVFSQSFSWRDTNRTVPSDSRSFGCFDFLTATDMFANVSLVVTIERSSYLRGTWFEILTPWLLLLVWIVFTIVNCLFCRRGRGRRLMMLWKLVLLDQAESLPLNLCGQLTRVQRLLNILLIITIVPHLWRQIYHLSCIRPTMHSRGAEWRHGASFVWLVLARGLGGSIALVVVVMFVTHTSWGELLHFEGCDLALEFADLLLFFKYHLLLLLDLFDCFLLGETCKFLHSFKLVGQILAFGK